MKADTSPQSIPSPAQKRREQRQELEAIIYASNLKTGEALKKIRDDRLYRDDYSSFDEYCQRRWGHKRAWADRLIKNVELICLFEDESDLGIDPTGSGFLLNESQARALRGLTPDEQIQVMKEVLASGKNITAKLIAEFAQKYKQPIDPELEEELEQEFEDEYEEEEDWEDDSEDAVQVEEIHDRGIELNKLVGHCIEVIRSQQEQIHQQKAQIRQLERENADHRELWNIVRALNTGQMRFIRGKQ